jgi:hypothetical protein
VSTAFCFALIDEAQCRRCAGGKKEGKWQWIVAEIGIIGAVLVCRELRMRRQFIRIGTSMSLGRHALCLRLLLWEHLS